MLTTKQFTFSVVMLLAIIVVCSSALAARYVPVAIYLNGELILEGNVSDNGSPDADAVWENLKRANLRETVAFQRIQPDKTVKTFELGTRETPVRLSVRTAVILKRDSLQFTNRLKTMTIALGVSTARISTACHSEDSYQDQTWIVSFSLSLRATLGSVFHQFYVR